MRVIINLQYSDGTRIFSSDLEVPATVCFRDLSNWLARALKIDDTNSEFIYQHTLSAPLLDNRLLLETETLASVGLWDGSTLVLKSQRTGRKKVSEKDTSPIEAKATALLISKMQTYPIAISGIWIGRSTPRTSPEILKMLIDLKDEPNADSVSRQHTQIIIEGKKYFLKTPSKNIARIFINNENSKPDVPQSITEGDEIRVGKVTLQFKYSGS